MVQALVSTVPVVRPVAVDFPRAGCALLESIPPLLLLALPVKQESTRTATGLDVPLAKRGSIAIREQV